MARRLLTARDGGIAGSARCSLDRELQVVATETVRRHLCLLGSHNLRDGAALVLDHSSGQVLAYVGNGGEVSSARHVGGTRAARQAGSTLKPFLYGLAFEGRALTPASLIDDRPLDLPVAGGLYQPGNYDHRYRGPVSCPTALASSLNVPAVRVLELVGVESLVDGLEALGFRSLRAADYYGPSLAMGSADITLWDLAAAYAALARGGTTVAPTLGASGAGTNGVSVLSPEAAFLISDILADREARSRTFSLESGGSNKECLSPPRFSIPDFQFSVFSSALKPGSLDLLRRPAGRRHLPPSARGGGLARGPRGTCPHGGGLAGPVPTGEVPSTGCPRGFPPARLRQGEPGGPAPRLRSGVRRQRRGDRDSTPTREPSTAGTTKPKPREGTGIRAENCATCPRPPDAGPGRGTCPRATPPRATPARLRQGEPGGPAPGAGPVPARCRSLIPLAR